jgi:hypothetical protein
LEAVEHCMRDNERRLGGVSSIQALGQQEAAVVVQVRCMRRERGAEPVRFCA